MVIVVTIISNIAHVFIVRKLKCKKIKTERRKGAMKDSYLNATLKLFIIEFHNCQHCWRAIDRTLG